MVAILLRFRVTDFNAWKAIFHSRDDLRRRAGCLGRRVWRTVEDPHQVVLILEWSDLAAYRAFAETGVAQTEEGRRRAGIVGEPETLVLEEAADIAPWKG